MGCGMNKSRVELEKEIVSKMILFTAKVISMGWCPAQNVLSGLSMHTDV